MLRTSHDSITIGSKPSTAQIGGIRSDGLVRPEESEWGRYLMTFPDHDHLDIVGFNPSYKPNTVYTLIVDNIRLSEIKEDPKEARDYGVDHLF